MSDGNPYIETGVHTLQEWITIQELKFCYDLADGREGEEVRAAVKVLLMYMLGHKLYREWEQSLDDDTKRS